MNYKQLPKGYRYAGTMDFTRNRRQILALLKSMDFDVYLDGAYVGSYSLAKEQDAQTVWFPETTCRTVRVVITDTHKGSDRSSSYPDVCITEIELVGSRELTAEQLPYWGRSVRSCQTALLYGQSLSVGSEGFAVVGLQVLLRDGFGTLNGLVDGDFGSSTQSALIALQDSLSLELGDSCQQMRYGVADQAFWNNLTRWLDR